jgi:Flp pilus assembly protein TadD
MLNKVTKINWLLWLVFAILSFGCSTTAPIEEGAAGSQKSRPPEYNYAVELLKRSELDKAHAVLIKLADTYKDSDLYANLAIINIYEKNYDKAREYIDKSLSINGNNPVSRNLQGIIYRQQGKFDQAETEYSKSIKLKPDYPAPYLNMAIMYDIYLDQAKQALPYYEKYKELDDGENSKIDKWIIEVKRRAK